MFMFSCRCWRSKWTRAADWASRTGLAFPLGVPRSAVMERHVSRRKSSESERAPAYQLQIHSSSPSRPLAPNGRRPRRLQHDLNPAFRDISVSCLRANRRPLSYRAAKEHNGHDHDGLNSALGRQIGFPLIRGLSCGGRPSCATKHEHETTIGGQVAVQARRIRLKWAWVWANKDEHEGRL